jgi:DNA-binding response OmpR family regulator
LLQAIRIHADIFDQSIDAQIVRLGRRLESDPSAPRIIKTERGIGYLFTLSVDPLQRREHGARRTLQAVTES